MMPPGWLPPGSPVPSPPPISIPVMEVDLRPLGLKAHTWFSHIPGVVNIPQPPMIEITGLNYFARYKLAPLFIPFPAHLSVKVEVVPRG